MTQAPDPGPGPLDFLVNRRDLSDCRFAPAEPAPAELRPGQVLLGIDSFGLTANNVTYAALGEAMGFWKFFPAPPGWGRVPVWGYADVLASRHPHIEAGGRLFGYHPMSTRAVGEFGDAAGGHVDEITPHRRELPAVYNRYAYTAPGARADARAEDLQAVFKPLFNTAFLLDDFLADQGFFGARRVVIASASSKTALGLACLLSRRPDRPQVIGLTSAANIGFVRRTGFFDGAIAYEDVASIPADAPAVFVDMAGNAEVVGAVHRHLGEQLRYSCRVGLTHWNKTAAEQAVPGVQPVLFFAPAQSHKRVQEWGAGRFLARCDAAWAELAQAVPNCVDIVRLSGPAAVQRTYLDLLGRRVPPDQAHVLSWGPPQAA
ncbi:MAG: DUF2855 family protein [Pseudomonadota bacterium]